MENSAKLVPPFTFEGKLSLGPWGAVSLILVAAWLFSPGAYGQRVARWPVQHYFLVLNVMRSEQMISETQVVGIKYSLGEQLMMTEMFSRYGLLGEEELRRKITDILEVTQFRIESALTPGQWQTWRNLDRKLQPRIGLERNTSSL